MRDLAAHVVKNVCLRDAVRSEPTEPAHECTAIAQEMAIESCEGSTGERKFSTTEMGKEGIGVLQKRDQNEPMICPGTSKGSTSVAAYMTAQECTP